MIYKFEVPTTELKEVEIQFPQFLRDSANTFVCLLNEKEFIRCTIINESVWIASGKDESSVMSYLKNLYQNTATLIMADEFEEQLNVAINLITLKKSLYEK
jgi:hypothetical protein